MNDMTSESLRDPSYRRLIIFLLLVVVVWLLSGFLVSRLNKPGEFGDMFGAVNALFSGLAFAGLLFTIYMQRVELRLQRLELAATRKEVAGQRQQLEAQNELIRTEGFESSFFRVLTVLAQIVESIDLSAPPLKGRDCFRRFYERVREAYKTSNVPGESEEKIVTRVYSDFYERYQGDVGHYFRTLYNLVKLVDRSSVEDKRFYTNLIRAQLSNQETLLLFYNCSCGHGREKFKPLVERYALLKNMPKERLLSQDHLAWFESKAYE